VRVPVAKALADLAGRAVLDDEVLHHSQQWLVEGDVGELGFAGEIPLAQRQKGGESSVDAGHPVCYRVTGEDG
jgi:hypothetical protein